MPKMRLPGRPFPEDVSEEFAAEFERRRQAAFEDLVHLVGIERRDREARVERSRAAIRKAKATLYRTRHIHDDLHDKVMTDAYRILRKTDR
jgi:hypothetical protein